mgnify:CR=1 FL=1
MFILLAAQAYFNASSSVLPYNSIEQNAPVNVSPAPVVFYTLEIGKTLKC